VELQRGVRLVVAPRFPGRLEWSDRLQINGGVDTVDGRFCPRRDWRPPDHADFDRLIGGPPSVEPAGAAPKVASADAVLPPSDVGSFHLPSHLRRAWWALADSPDALAGDGRSYHAFARDAIEFLRLEVAVRGPGEPPAGWLTPSGAAGASESGENRPSPAGERERVVAVVNLGDEPTHLVLLNLAPAAMAALIGAPWPIDPARGACADLLGRFFTALPSYPLVRVRLEAGDGLWFPAHGLVHDVCTLDKREVDVALTLRDDTTSEAGPHS
jgi:hypothetical protein